MPRLIKIEKYNEHWVQEFNELKQEIAALLGEHAHGIEHIGSTSVPGLGAKDIIDIQIGVQEFEIVKSIFTENNWTRIRMERDEFFGMDHASEDLAKLYVREPEGRRRVHVHIRQVGRFNHRFSLLFRDYLRANSNARVQYEELKQQASKVYPHDIDGYLALKTPLINLLYHLGDAWAKATNWDENLLPKYCS